jgi:hypothetical protein
MKALKKVRIEEEYLKIIRTTCDRNIANIILMKKN